MTAAVAPFSRARLELAKLTVDDHASLVEACAHAARLSRETLQVSRVGVWVFDETKTTLACLTLQGDAGGTPPIQRLTAAEFPAYLGALRDRRWIAAEDTAADPLTSELRAKYLEPQGIVSMLDAPIFRGAELFGIVCHEQVGERMAWSDHAKAFAGSIADILALIFEQDARLRADRLRQTLEAERRHAQKLEVVGRVALSVAHDVNNVLTTIQLLATDLVNTTTRPQAVRDILSAVRSGTELTRSLVSMARQPSKQSARPCDAVAVTRGFASLLQAMVRGQAALSVDLPDEPLVVAGSASQIQQILLNLVVNARDALEYRGHIDVELRRLEVEGAARALIRVRDDGPGMTEAVRQRLFEPFFTTKPEGTGWGLTIVREVVDALGGTVSVVSSPGRGTTFEILLPLDDGEDQSPNVASE